MLLDSEMVKVLPFVSMTIEEENVKFNVRREGGTMIVKVTTRQSIILIGLHGSNCLYPLSICA